MDLGPIIILILPNIILAILFFCILLYIKQGENREIHSITYPFLAPKGVYEEITNGLLTFILSLLGKN